MCQRGVCISTFGKQAHMSNNQINGRIKMRSTEAQQSLCAECTDQQMERLIGLSLLPPVDVEQVVFEIAESFCIVLSLKVDICV